MSKRILIVGSTSFIAKAFIESNKKDTYTFYLTSRDSDDPSKIFLDFNNNSSISEFSIPSNTKLDGIIFFQGINPTLNAKNTTYEHLRNMFDVNVIGPLLLIQKLHNQLTYNATIIFFSSIASKKGSYDPGYASAKSSIKGLIQSLSNEFPSIRFNAISLGLVENSPVYNQMTVDYRTTHTNKMFNRELIKIENVISILNEVLSNSNISRAVIPVDGGYS